MERHKKNVESSSEAKDTAAATLSTAVGFPDDIENIVLLPVPCGQ